MRLWYCTHSVALALIVFLAPNTNAQDYPGTGATFIRELYYAGDRFEEIYIFPLAATKTTIVFASCPSVALPDGNGEIGTVCRMEWLAVTDGFYQPTRREDVSGCTIEEYWNIDCPEFTSEGLTYGNTVKLIDSLRKTYPMPSDLFRLKEGITTEILPFTPSNLGETIQISGYAENMLSYHFVVLDTCDFYAAEPAFAEACGRAVGAVSEGQSILGVTAMVIQERGIVCAIAEDWSIPACSGTR